MQHELNRPPIPHPEDVKKHETIQKIYKFALLQGGGSEHGLTQYKP